MSAKVGVLFISYKLILVRCTISVAVTLKLCLSMRSLPVVDPHYAAYLFAVLYSTVGTAAEDLTCVAGFGKKGERRS